MIVPELGGRAARDGTGAPSGDGVDLRRERAGKGSVRPGGSHPGRCLGAGRGLGARGGCARRGAGRSLGPLRGEGATDEANLQKLLDELARAGDGPAGRYVCELVGLGPGSAEIRGDRRAREAGSPRRPRGSEGFGYDPVFVPEGEKRTVAELGDAWKARTQPPRAGRASPRTGLGRHLPGGVRCAGVALLTRHEGRGARARPALFGPVEEGARLSSRR